jgi:hypothetical protein
VRTYFLAVAVATVLILAGRAPPAHSQGAVIAHAVEQAQTIDRAAVEQLPAVEEQISFLTGHGQEQATYTGALLWSVLQRTEALDADPRTRLRRIITVTGRDGYVAVLALAEIDPEFAGKQVLIAYRRNGEALGDNELRLIVPGDRRGGRSVRDVVRIELR